MIELTVLGCSGSYGAPAGGACSGYLVRAGGVTIWLDCGNGTLPALMRHADPTELSAVVITHVHPDHCVDLYGLHVLNRYGLERLGLPVYAPGGLEETMRALVGEWGGAFDWVAVGDEQRIDIGPVGLRFSRTDHPPPTLAVEIAHDGKRLVYTSDTGPLWSPDVFDPGADLLLSEATYEHNDIRSPLHISARQAGEKAKAAGARRLMITHLWPTVDPNVSVAEASAAFGAPVTLAAPNLRVTI